MPGLFKLLTLMKIPGEIPFFFSSTVRKTRCTLAGWLLWFTLGGAPAASASDVLFTQGGYAFDGSTVTLSMDSITNDSANTTGTLRMELWAFSNPYVAVSGAVTGGYRLAVSPSLGMLDGDSHFTTSPITETAAVVPPPNGTYYLTLFLSEYQGGDFDDGYEDVDFVNFTDTMSFDTNGASFGVSSAVPVGGGYFYDSDLDYIYPLGDGFIYLSDLDRYYYVDPGTDFTTGTYIFDFFHNSYTYTEKSFWPYVYYFDGTGWVDTGFN